MGERHWQYLPNPTVKEASSITRSSSYSIVQAWSSRCTSRSISRLQIHIRPVVKLSQQGTHHACISSSRSKSNFHASGSGRRHYRPAFLFASLWNCPLAPFPSEIFAPLSLLRSIPPFRPKAFSPSDFSLFLPKMFSPLSLLRSRPFPP